MNRIISLQPLLNATLRNNNINKYNILKYTTNNNIISNNSSNIINRSFHNSKNVKGFEEFYDQKKPNDIMISGRAWTAADLRRKGFDDLHKLWYVLYKERNLILSEREKIRKQQRPTTDAEEYRYIKVKKSMAAIKFVLSERTKIRNLIKEKEGNLNSPKS